MSGQDAGVCFSMARVNLLNMPIFKILHRGSQEQREEFIQRRVRLVALLVSGALFLATAALLLSHAAHHTV